MDGHHSHISHTYGRVDHFSYEFLCYHWDLLLEALRFLLTLATATFLRVWEASMSVIYWDSCWYGRIGRTWYCLPLLRASGDCLPLLLARSLRRQGLLLILLGTTIFYETGHEVSITLLGPLRDLDRVATFDWGSTTLAYLYYRLDTVCRGTVTVCGFWHVLHVCFFILFNFLISYTTSLSDSSLFRSGASRLGSFEVSTLLASIGVSHWCRDGALLAYLALDTTCRLTESSWTP